MQSGFSVWCKSCRNATEVAMATEWLTEWIGCTERHMLNAERGCLCQREGEKRVWIFVDVDDCCGMTNVGVRLLSLSSDKAVRW